jgi:hypothetical protein
MPPAHTTRQNLTDALLWLFETVVCAAIFSFGARIFFLDIFEDGGWRLYAIGISIWLLGALCATIDVRQRRRKRLSAPTS